MKKDSIGISIVFLLFFTPIALMCYSHSGGAGTHSPVILSLDTSRISSLRLSDGHLYTLESDGIIYRDGRPYLETGNYVIDFFVHRDRVYFLKNDGLHDCDKCVWKFDGGLIPEAIRVLPLSKPAVLIVFTNGEYRTKYLDSLDSIAKGTESIAGIPGN